jgi:DNA polymerase-3 subunit gamma/tau
VPAPVIIGSAAPATLRETSPEPEKNSHEREGGPTRPAPSDEIAKLQLAVLEALTDGNQHVLVSMLSSGEWSVETNDLVIKVPESQTVIDMSVGAEAKRIAIASASGVLGRATRLKIVSSAAVAGQENKRDGTARAAGSVGGRSRAEQDPVVRRMQEKFGAEIRTVIDYREKRDGS